MYLSHHQPAPAGRRGVILLVVIALLSMFAVVGVSFVLYSQAQSDAARIYRDSQALVGNQPQDAPKTLLGQFLHQIVFDLDDMAWSNAKAVNVSSAVRGHSFARTMWGYNYPRFANDPSVPNSQQVPFPNPNTNAYSGTGRLHSDSPQTMSPVVWRDPNSSTNLAPLDEFFLPNYTYFNWDYFGGNPVASQIGLHDPERLGWRMPTQQNPNPLTLQPGPFAGGFNPSYTYPDANNMFLAAVKADGTVLAPSFHRPWLAHQALVAAAASNQGLANYLAQNPDMSLKLDPNDPKWTDTTNSCWRYMTLRPRPADHAKDAQGNFLFPKPQMGGDVSNLGGSKNDSIWIDLGIPKKQLPDGRWYKPLFAPLIIDLDGRVNINAHGNIRGAASGFWHVSNQGWGPWEVNLAWVLNYNYTNSDVQNWQQLTNPPQPGNAQPPPEWSTLYLGSHNFAGIPNVLVPPTKPIYGRYGPDGYPDFNAAVFNDPLNTAAVAPTLITQPHFYSQIDYDAWDAAGAQYSGLPAYTGAGIVYPGFPLYQNGTINQTNGWYNANLSATPTPTDERFKHPLAYNPYLPAVTTAPTTQQVGIFDRSPSPLSPGGALFADSALAALILNPRDSTATALAQTDLGILCRSNLISDTSPYTLNTSVTNAVRRRWMLTTRSFDVDQPGFTPGIFNPTDPAVQYVMQGDLERAPAGQLSVFPALNQYTPQQNGDFAVDWRGFANVPGAPNGLGRVDLNRKLTPYPRLDTTTGMPTYSVRFDVTTQIPNSNPPATYDQQFQAAQGDRQALAKDIYRRLLHVTGVPPAATPATPTPAELMPRRWLAQLAVNIVDYIDEDDISTPFNFYDMQTDGLVAISNIGDADTTLSPELFKYWVFGTEMPSLVLNEALGECKPPTAGMPSTTFANNFWVELHNPRVAPSATSGVSQLDVQPIALAVSQTGTGVTVPIGGGQTELVQSNSTAAYAPYKIVIVPYNAPQQTGLLSLATNNNNVLGTPDNTQPAPTPRTETQDADFTDAARVFNPNGTPVNATATVWPNNTPNQSSFAIVGPDSDTTNAVIAAAPQTTQWIKTNTGSMQYSSTGDSTSFTPNDTSTGVTVFLRRLANPHLPYDERPVVTMMSGQPAVNPMFNPYVTIDYMDKVKDNKVNDPLVTSWNSQGKRQPFASRYESDTTPPKVSQIVDQDQGTAQPKNTFGDKNSPGPATSTGYRWPMHVDRQLVSPMELLNVAAYKPHQLLQFFMNNEEKPDNHLAPWFDQDLVGVGPARSHRLYRLFEYLQTNSRMAGTVDNNYTGQNPNQGRHVAGRVPGKININTIWDPEVFLALCDPQASNGFAPSSIANLSNPSDINTVFGKLLASRTPGYSSNTLLYNDQPFTSYAAFGQPSTSADAQHPVLQFPNGFGLQNTIFRRAVGSTDRLFDVTSAAHPYQKNELLNKISSNITTRSNVFAVWLTVGFFEVKDPTTLPEKLGKELGIDQGYNVRHQMFAIVDRSALAYVPPNVPPFTYTGTINTGVPGTPVQLAAPVPQSPLPDYAQSIVPGSIVTLDDNGANAETVVVLGAGLVGTGQNRVLNLAAKFNKKHTGTAQAPIRVWPTLPGNPGTQSPNWDPIDNSAVVPYFKLLTKAPGS